ncbi:hypothetical protein TELCIR_16943 [Teladorsagia circumcincta]|uniref:DIX domain-containing protein n=1 Tax=Teladorsagia circumcincta TaxID=45464 RepID=A0A2G9TU42_TELCI|nr:hypothetical protein TELCIR_16943 [Teladorsagia circumcincta]
MALDGCPFSSSVDAVLQDAAALQAFREWIRLDPSRPADCLALHFAIKGSKPRAYSCDASSRDIDDSSRPIAVDRERNVFKHTDGSIRHDLPEAREAFASVLSERLDVISKELERCDENTYARDLPRDLAACSLLPSLHDSRILEETTSDEEVEKYVGRIDGTRRRSESTSPVMFNYGQNKVNHYENGFAPPPQSLQLQFPDVPTPPPFPTSNKSIDYRFSDSSGFCSSESAYLSDRSFGRKKMSFDFHPHHLGSNSLSRKHSSIPPQNVFATLQFRTIAPSMTLVLRDNGQPPMVAKIPTELITLARFRRIFGISRTENRRFLFKSTCEDGSAPFQWSLITDDDALLPTFDGKITAECRHFTDSD